MPLNGKIVHAILDTHFHDQCTTNRRINLKFKIRQTEIKAKAEKKNAYHLTNRRRFWQRQNDPTKKNYSSAIVTPPRHIDIGNKGYLVENCRKFHAERWKTITLRHTHFAQFIVKFWSAIGIIIIIGAIYFYAYYKDFFFFILLHDSIGSADSLLLLAFLRVWFSFWVCVSNVAADIFNLIA